MRKLFLTGLVLLFIMPGVYAQQTYPQQTPTSTNASKKIKVPEMEIASTISAITLVTGIALVIRGRRKKSTI